MTEATLETLSPLDYLQILQHRKLYFLVPSVLAMLIGVLVVMSLPPVYRSGATVLIESQQIPEEFVNSTVTSFADERIEIVKQRVLTSENLVPIVTKVGLYSDKRERLTPSELSDLVRENFEIELVSAQTGQRGRQAQTTIAFNIYFNDPEPRAAQRVVNELVTLFLAQDVDIRTTKTRETHEFLVTQSVKLAESIATNEKQIAEFKTKYRAQLPESVSANQGVMDRLSGAHRDVMGRVQALRNSIEVLEAQYAATAATAAAGGAAGSLTQLQQELARLRSIYTDKHPEVIALQERIAAAKSTPPDTAATIDDPASVQLRSQISASRSELAFLEGERKSLEKQLAEIESSINSAPEIERQYNELLRDMTNLTTEYKEVKSKALESEIALQMETEQKGERFKLIEAPAVPTEPFSPDRPKLLVLVLFASLAAGGGMVLLIEMAQPLLRGNRAIGAVLGQQALVVVPYIETTDDIQRRRRRLRTVLIAAAVGAVVVLLVVHFFVIELDLLWYELTLRLGNL